MTGVVGRIAWGERPRRFGGYPDTDTEPARYRRRPHRPTVVGMAAMTTSETAAELEELLREIERYLAAVDEFRRQGREPRWRAEEVRR